jgi:hypothetical protein
MSKIWVDIDISPYYNYRIIAHRPDNGVVGVLKDNALKKAKQVIELYDCSGMNYSVIYDSIEIDERLYTYGWYTTGRKLG